MDVQVHVGAGMMLWSKRPWSVVGYPLVLLAGMGLGITAVWPELEATAIGSTSQPISADALAPMTPEQARAAQIVASPAGQGRLGAESVELRELRRVEAELFPERGSRDHELSEPHNWDPLPGGALALPPSPQHYQTRTFGLQPPPQARAGTGYAQPRQAAHRDSYTDRVFDGLRMPDVNVERNSRVAKYIRYFTASRKGRATLTKWLERSGRFGEIINEALDKRLLPKALASIVYIESGFWPTARSKAGAVGLWQLMPNTARAYGLVVDKTVDERRNPWKSTAAAVEHLEDLYDRFHRWDLALAAYNVGYRRVLTRMKELGVDNFWDLTEIDGALPRETELYVPKVLAISVIVNNLDHFGLDAVRPQPPIRAAKVEVPPGISLAVVAQAAGTPLRTLRDLNAELRIDSTPDRGGPAVLRIPRDRLSRLRSTLPDLLVESGEAPLEVRFSEPMDLAGRGSRYSSLIPGSSQRRAYDDALPGYDRMGDKHDLRERRRDRHERRQARVERDRDDAARDDRRRRRDRASDDDSDAIAPRRRRDTERPRTRVERSKDRLERTKLNLGGLKLFHLTSLSQTGSTDPWASGQLRPGSLLPSAQVQHTVKRGDTIWKIAQLYGVSERKLIKQNKLKDTRGLQEGQVLIVNVPERSSADKD